MTHNDAEARCELVVRGRLDGIAEWCVTHNLWVTERGCAATREVREEHDG